MSSAGKIGIGIGTAMAASIGYLGLLHPSSVKFDACIDPELEGRLLDHLPLTYKKVCAIKIVRENDGTWRSPLTYLTWGDPNNKELEGGKRLSVIVRDGETDEELCRTFCYFPIGISFGDIKDLNGKLVSPLVYDYTDLPQELLPSLTIKFEIPNRKYNHLHVELKGDGVFWR